MYVPNFLGGARIRPEVLFFDSGGGADDGGDGCCLVGGLASTSKKEGADEMREHKTYD